MRVSSGACRIRTHSDGHHGCTPLKLDPSPITDSKGGSYYLFILRLTALHLFSDHGEFGLARTGSTSTACMCLSQLTSFYLAKLSTATRVNVCFDAFKGNISDIKFLRNLLMTGNTGIKSRLTLLRQTCTSVCLRCSMTQPHNIRYCTYP